MTGALSMEEVLDILTLPNILLVGLLFVLLYVFRNKISSANYPPCYSGWLPYVGCAIEFGKSPLWFIEESRKKYGPVFTLKVAGKRLTFVTDHEDFHHFLSSPNVDFQTVVQDPVQHAASVSKKSFFENHTKIHDTVKGCLAPQQLEPFCHNLFNKFSEQLEEWGNEGDADLMTLTRRTMYIAVLDNLFGDNVLPTKDKEAFLKLEKHFVNYDDLFEYGSQLPEIFIKSWSKSKWWLLGQFKKVAKTVFHKENADNKTVLETLISIVDKPHAGNYGLLLMWASLANAIPITFWTLGYILTHPKVLEEVKSEVMTMMKSNPEMTQETVCKFSCIKRCMMEAIRLRSPGVITRGVIKPFTIKGHTIPVGDMLMLSPYWAHRSEKFFPEPERFNPDRWKACNLDNNQFLEGFVAFGGGRYQCPGRWFAILEMQLLIAMIFHKFDVKALDPLPSQSPLHLVGTQQPESNMKIHFKAREK